MLPKSFKESCIFCNKKAIHGLSFTPWDTNRGVNLALCHECFRNRTIQDLSNMVEELIKESFQDEL